MAKIKHKKNANNSIRVILFLMKGTFTLAHLQFAISTAADQFNYDQIKQFCQGFLQKEGVTYQTNIYTPDLNNLQYHSLVTKDYKFNVIQLVDKLQGSLILIIKSVYQELRTQFQTQIELLKDEIISLRQTIDQLKPLKDNIQLLRKKSTFHPPSLISVQSIGDKDSQQIQLDIAVLFSQPLYNDQKKKPTMPAVDFRSQISRLNIALQGSFKPNISLRCQIATIQSLKNIIKYSKPKILHIICHGNSEGFLQFQDDSRNTLGVLQLIKPQQIKIILKNLLQFLPQLVFVNSCHSQLVGKSFFQLGVKNVIMINSQDLISDEAAQIFSQNFYRNIFRGETVMESFLSAKKRVQLHHMSGCCCNHSAVQPHRQNCRWLKLMRRYPNPHKDYHVPSSKCECHLRNFNRHNVQCEWARKVLFQLNDHFRIPDQNRPGQYRFPQFTAEFPDYYDKTKKQLVICCCPTKGRRPHSQSNKFIILAKDDGKYPLVHIVHDRSNPQVNDYTSIQLLESHEKSKAIFGRQRQLFEFLKRIKQFNFTVIFGKSGTGLTTFAIKASTYLMQRRIFEFFFFIDLYDIKDQTIFRYKFNQITKFQYNGITINQVCMKNRKILLLFDNCDDFINGQPLQFYKQIQTLLRQIPKCKIIIIFKQQTLQLFDDKKIICKKFQLVPFQTRYAISFLNAKLKDKTDISVGFQQFKKLVNQYEVLKIPKVIQSLSQSLSDNKKKLVYQVIQQSVIGIKVSDTNKLTQSVLDQLKKKSQQAFQFLIFISQLSDGISYDDLNIFSLYSRKDMSIHLPIKKNWQEHYMMLFQKDKQKNCQNCQKQKQSIKLLTVASHTDLGHPNGPLQQKANPQMKPLTLKKHESDAVTSSVQNNYSQLDDIKEESYFIDKNGKGKFIVKRFIRDFVWKKYANQTTNQMKFLYVAYFSAVLQILFDSLKKMNCVHQQLQTYSAISNAGIFHFSTTLQDTYQKTVLTNSIKLAKQFMSDIDCIFNKNDQLLQKIKNTDPTTFIMNHRHDFLKIYDNNWTEVYKHLEKKKSGEEKVFTVLLQNLMVYIPTALKIAKADDSLLRYALKSSLKWLLKMQDKSKAQRSLKLQLKICLIQIGISFDMQKQQSQSISRAYNIIGDFLLKQSKNQEIMQVQKVFNEQIFAIDLLKDLSRFKIHTNNQVEYLVNRKIEYCKNKQILQIQPLIKAKQGLILSLLFLKCILKNPVQMKIYLRIQNGQLKQQILKICFACSSIFKDYQCYKLQLKSQLCQLQLFWEFNQKYQQQGIDAKQYAQIDKWRVKLSQCQEIYLNPKNRLRGFTQFDTKIKSLKKQVKQKLWKSASKRIIFMKAYPLATRQHNPILKNLVRKKNNFRKQIELLLTQAIKQSSISQKKLPIVYNSPILRTKQSKQVSEKKIQLDVSTKFEILTKQKIIQQSKARCSIMYLTVDIRIINKNVYMISQNSIMQQQLIQINQSLAQQFNFDNVRILVLSGVNTSKAMKKIRQISLKPPIIIALHSDPVQNYDQIDYTHESDTDSIRQQIKRQNEIKEAQIAYTRHFIKKITQSIITSNQDVKNIHEEACKKMITQSDSNKVQAFISIDQCNKNIHLQYNQGTYRDLSPGYERNNNIDQKYYDNKVLLRRWRKMIQFFKFLRQKQGESKPINDQTSPSYNQQYNYSQSDCSCINVYGETGCGKTYFIRQLAKISVQRQFYDLGVFLFDGKKIQNNCNGDFQLYIKKQANISKMPVLQDFEKLLGQKTVLIIDDFHCIKSRSNARVKIFMDKIQQKKVNLILVSVNQLKLQLIPRMKKIKIQSFDSFQTQVLAYNILNISNPDQINAYHKLKDQSKKKSKITSIKEIYSCRELKFTEQAASFIDYQVSCNMKKTLTTLG